MEDFTEFLGAVGSQGGDQDLPLVIPGQTEIDPDKPIFAPNPENTTVTNERKRSSSFVKECSLCDGGAPRVTEKQAKLLPCLHTFCADCLEQYITDTEKDGYILCPSCQFCVEVPKDGVLEMEDNIFRQIENEIPSERFKKCDLYHPEVAVGRCVNCKKDMCSDCLTSHKNAVPAWRDHLVLEFVEGLPGEERSVRIAKEQCTRHQRDEIKIFCTTCSQSICVKCKVTDHAEHTATDLAHPASEHREKMTTLVAEIMSAFGTLHDRVRQEKSLKSEYQNGIKIKQEFLKSRIAAIKQELETIEEVGFKQLEDALEKEMANFDRRIQNLQIQIKSMQEVVDYATKFIHYSNNTAIMNKHETLENTLGRSKKVNNSWLRESIEVRSDPEGSLDLLKDIIGKMEVTRQLSEKVQVEKVQWKDNGSKSKVQAICPTSPTETCVASENDFRFCRKDGAATTPVSIGQKNVIFDVSADCYGNVYAAFGSHAAKSGNPLQKLSVFGAASDTRYVCGINKISESGIVKEICSAFAPGQCGYIFGIGVTRDGRIIMSCGEDSSKGVALNVVDREGRFVNDIKPMDRDGPFNPGRLAVNKHDEIAVISNGELFFMFLDGYIKASLVDQKVFTPRSNLAFSNQGHIYVAVLEPKSTVFIYDEHANWLGKIQAPDILHPTCISVDHDGDVWIGKNNGHVVVYHFLH